MGRKQPKTAENLCLGFGCREGKEFCKGLRLGKNQKQYSGLTKIRTRRRSRRQYK
ncbi:hypothetical protein I7K80_02335 [Neisseria meningitidis]|uniref:hypothetical protein n=1 Tax=Neisseria meningitidis TaxID=487 RepID=UPI0003079A81|nr:hypothetical protein [Neisseria meningitidis]MBH2325451.1 hypothetical protein [Neisseria meningitidis]MBH2337028.1 hypothetical protein [Neisseria meningitidis]MBH2425062.1 hypothetical protein [Neisseria meningitidis]MBH2441680.1 hypothetical protein [Neisseria meningitidis]MBH2500482.1 hypothetical protein [Neisseria meningitidis]